ncbi:phage antirepressor KilAC domain-containing protein [Clostridium sardiniense]|uniref:Phage antirepressor KilAC domain-containing protein n=1 Tax=Clostridium sardiniense TaxID=29369 RepID=A0ABS7L0F1_CLOSR|nr:phage antirepressor KilAC domain-containing protein [Clostridium sardiniense]MBY0756545.1 phage antirepressor KilAC domain-containing protein [Clostridium sardiniense]MDQ0460294.1 anti-repressor protein [Clostridium sardiniense]
MNNLMIFENKPVEVFELDGQVLFNPKHVAECLEIKNVNDNIRAMNEKQVIKLTNSKIGKSDFRKLHNTGENFLTESGVYKLIFKSKKKEAEKFQDWVTDVVLPSIRKYGTYMTDNTLEKALTSPDFLIKLATNLKEEQTKRILLEEEKERNAPKVIFANAVSTSHTSILVGELAKLIKQNGVDIGERRLFNWLRDNGYLIKRKGTDYNMPTQKSLELKVIETKERTINNPDGSIRITKTPKVTGKGQQYFINKFLN